MNCQIVARLDFRCRCLARHTSDVSSSGRALHVSDVLSRHNAAAVHVAARKRRSLAAAPALWQEREQALAQEQELSMKEYLELKQLLLKRCQRFGSFFTLYILLTVSGQAALCSMAGSVGSYLYLAWLCQDVDAVRGTDCSPMREADAIRDALPRRIAKAVVGYRMSLQPRLLVPIVLAASVALYNSESAEPLTLLEEACVLGGFLSYKVALILKVWDDTRPRFSKPAARRPQWKEIDDDLDIYGRAKPKSVGLQEAERVLAEEEAKKAARKPSAAQQREE